MEIRAKIANKALEGAIYDFVTAFSAEFANALQSDSASVSKFEHQSGPFMDTESMTVMLGDKTFIVMRMSSKPSSDISA